MSTRADVYALGVLLFELLRGQVPFPRDTAVSKMFAHVNDPPPLLAQFFPEPARFDPVLQRALSKNPRDRFLSAGDLARAAAAANEMRAVSVDERSVARAAAASADADTVLDQIPPPPPVLPEPRRLRW